jgi:membrane protein implicated in regulation of membrane protease activity
MLSIYVGSLLFGGVLLGASIMGGHADGHVDPAAAGGADGAGHEHDYSRLPFLSLRFWAFAAAFFGLSGAALTVFGALGALTPLVAGGVGLGCGYVSARVLSGLSRNSVGLLGDANAHLGREGRVLLPLGRGQRGKIRLQIGGTSTDLVAETDSEATLAPGDTALIVGMRGNVALVERNPATLPETTTPRLGGKQD